MIPAEILARCEAAGIRLRPLPDGRIGAAPRESLTEELRSLIRAHKAELLAALQVPEHAHAGSTTGADTAPAPSPIHVPDRGADCMRCANLTMRVEIHEGTRRVFWWRCEKGYALMEGRNFGERVLLAPPACGTAGAFEQWKEGQR